MCRSHIPRVRGSVRSRQAELLSDAVVETQDRRIFVANIKTNDELIPLKIIADKTAA
jgi:hypothetical protein